MTRYYKLTNEDGQTYGGTQWGPGVTHRAQGKGQVFCTEDFIHVYDDPLLAVLLNSIHTNFDKLRLWRCKVRHVRSDRGLEFGVKECTTLEELPLPSVTVEQRVRFGILCALEVYHEAHWVEWAHDWLSGRDRSASAAEAVLRTAAPILATVEAEWDEAEWVAVRAAWAPEETAAEAAAWVARGKTRAASAAAEAAMWAAWEETEEALIAAEAAKKVSMWAAVAAEGAVEAATEPLNLKRIARSAIKGDENA